MSRGILTNWNNTGRSWFIGIGINSYLEFPDLSNAVRDVTVIKELLETSYDIMPEYTVTLFNEEATEENILRQLDYLTKNVQPDDKVILYYSGHGRVNQALQRGYWMPHDAKKNSSSRYILNSTVQDYVGGIDAKHILLISDSCFSGSIFMRGESRSARASEVLESRKSRWAICSGRHDEEVYDGDPGGHSPFAQSLIDILSVTKMDVLPVGTVVDQVIQQTASNYNQLPDGRPMFGVGHGGGQYVFRKKNAKQEPTEFTKEVSEESREYVQKGASKSTSIPEVQTSTTPTTNSGDSAFKWMAVIVLGGFALVGAIIIGTILLVKDDANGSLDQTKSKQTVSDRLGRSYPTVQLGGQEWTQENMETEVTSIGTFWERPASEEVQAVYGLYYTFEGAKQACEKLDGNWSLPSNKDWQDLAYSMGHYMTPEEGALSFRIDEKLATAWVQPNLQGLNLTLGGLYLIDQKEFSADPVDANKEGHYWTKEKGRISLFQKGSQYYGFMTKGPIHWNHAYNCRCVHKAN